MVSLGFSLLYLPMLGSFFFFFFWEKQTHTEEKGKGVLIQKHTTTPLKSHGMLGSLLHWICTNTHIIKM